MHTDLYQVLGLAPGASADAIRKAYRAKAFELHPDRHGGSPAAEEGFKTLTAAYAVLGNADRRAAYDADRAQGRAWGPQPGAGGGAQGDPAELFRSLFRDPAMRGAFEQMAREFSRQGLRFDEAYLRKVFSGGHGTGPSLVGGRSYASCIRGTGPSLVGGVFFAGSLGGLLGSLLGGGPAQAPSAGAPPRPLPPRQPGLLQRLFHPALGASAAVDAPPLDLTYTLPVPTQVLAAGGQVEISLPDGDGRRAYRVQVPPGSLAGTRLRLQGKGRGAAGRRGDLLLELHQAD